MSYIIAHVAFDSSDRTYPVNCLRTDVAGGDNVVVRMGDGALKWARVADLNFLNWDCYNTIECLAQEADFTSDGILLRPGKSLSLRGMSRPLDLALYLNRLGWTRRRPANRAYRVAFTAANQTRTGLILMRKNGIDLQILEEVPQEQAERDEVLSTSRMKSPFIEHAYHGSDGNVLIRIAAYAEAFLRNAPELETLAAPRKTTKQLPRRPLKMRDQEERDDLYASFGGTGEPVYMGDGLWLTGGGGINDWAGRK